MAKAKNIMREFALDEISAVVRPAQKGARMVIMKRDDGDERRFSKAEIEALIAKGAAVITSATDGHTHLILIDDYVCMRGGGYTEYDYSTPNSHRHPFVIDEDTGAIGVGEMLGHTHTASTVLKGTATETEEMAMKPEQYAELLALASMNDTQKGHYCKLDDAGKTAFAALDYAGREAAVAAEVAKANQGDPAGADPVVYKTAGGIEVRKSDGATVLALAKQNDALMNALDVTKEAHLDKEAAELAKGWTHIGKPIEEKTALAKSILGLPEVARKAALDGIAAGKEALAPLFKNIGALGATSNPMAHSGPLEKLDTMAKEYAKTNNIGFHKAYDAVCMTEQGKALYEESLQSQTQH